MAISFAIDVQRKMLELREERYSVPTRQNSVKELFKSVELAKIKIGSRLYCSPTLKGSNTRSIIF
ncbi:hypothetical protein F441_21681 [Phytophthora nicotianae CJ01A1]|uniref:Uncharacterized protein n=2 Tax=Phytophthora nicotianae TaxID=4792 RepID=V9DX08_PHYNI|nr:hypothetical protein F443_21800 [Phytophthora nicotianae P1569]ETP01012.1 hypothetical protein F441_21681 [Phytophthora nicotianae CJ01A1]